MALDILAEIISRMGLLWETFLIEPKVYFAIIGEWFLVLIYFSISQDKEAMADVYAAGVTLGFIGFEILPFHNINFADQTVWLSFGLMLYGLMLIIFSACEKIPNILAKILGMPSAIGLPTMLVVLYFESQVPIDAITIGLLAIPVILLEAVKIFRQHSAI
tara:strand:- start:269 stop:751 length:483 start_codon:yes stop_codon:yes gene_type:complete